MQTFLSSGTYTPTIGMKYCEVSMVGGGGGGGSSLISGSSTASIGSGGGAGGYINAILTAAQIGASQTVTIGNGGAAATVGTPTSLGALLSCAGGAAGTASAATALNASSGGLGGTATVTTGSAIIAQSGQQGFEGFGVIVASNLVGKQGGGGNMVE